VTGFFQGVELLRGSRCGSRSRSCGWAAGSGKQRCNSGNDSDFNDFHIWLFGCCLATGNPRLMLRTLTDLNYLASTEFGGLKSAKLPQISQISLGNHEIHERHEVDEAKATCSNTKV